MKKIYIDYDSTLVDFIKPYLKKLNEKEKIELTHKTYKRKENEMYIKSNYDLMKVGDVYEEVEVFEGAIDFLNELRDAGYVLEVITSSMSGDQKFYKKEHMERNFAGFFESVIHARKKFPHTKDGFFIDDKLSNVEKHCENNETIGFLYNHKGLHDKDIGKIKELNKRKNFYYVESYSEMLNIINKKPTKVYESNQSLRNNKIK